MGRLADHAWSPPLGRAVVHLYSRFYDVRFDECVKAEGFSSFDEFFTRELKDGVRPIDPDPHVIVSPADGNVGSMGRIEPGSRFVVKGRPYLVEELVGDAKEAERYEGGGGCVVYLSPRDYHRVHSPVDGVIHHVRSLPGDYYPVNAIGMKHVPNLFVRNRRVSIAIDTPELGRVTAVMVAAIVVGRITVSGIEERDVPLGYHTLRGPRAVKRGDEIGMFHLGSTVVLLFEHRAVGTWLANEGPVLYGQGLVRALSVESTNGKSVKVEGGA